MFLRAVDVYTKSLYVNSSVIERIRVKYNETDYDVLAYPSGGGTGWYLAKAVSQADGRIARDKIVAAVRNLSEGHAFLLSLDSDTQVFVRQVSTIVTASDGGGTYRVDAVLPTGGYTLGNGYASQAAADAAMDAFAAGVGAVNTVKLIA